MDATTEKARLEELIARNDAARQSLGSHWQTLRNRVDIPARISNSIRSNRTLWFAGTATVGLLTSLFFRRKPPVVVAQAPRASKGLLGLALTTAFAFAKPALKTWLWSEVRKRVMPGVRQRRSSNARHFSD
jgi:hypothetical protein